ncbi:MAG: endopeptidase La [Clostridia bacterium]|nr:endopeptidase La [Clostridia bacterium]
MNNYLDFMSLYEGRAVLPVLALRGLVTFPQTLIHLDITEKIHISAIQDAMKHSRFIFLALENVEAGRESGNLSINTIGTIARIKQLLKAPAGEERAALEVFARGVITGEINGNEYPSAFVSIKDDEILEGWSEEDETAMRRKARETFAELNAIMDKLSPEIGKAMGSINDIGELADYIAQNVPFKAEVKQRILEEFEPHERLLLVIAALREETEILLLEQKVSALVNIKMRKNQRDYFIREQIRTLQEELGDGGADFFGDEDDEELYDRIMTLNASDETKEKLEKELIRLSKMPIGSQDGVVLRTYLETCLELPWNTVTKDSFTIEKASAIMEADHYGLKKVKERIIEMLAVRKLLEQNGDEKEKLKTQILCLVGPPGTGKTSVAMSVAKAMNRKFVRISLGGVHDEAEIRGHRRTYIGAMPGKILTALKEVKSSNPVMLLDEIDKLGNDYKGDPSAALLEVLDPEQNKTFRDNYVDIPYDLSDVLFITTANDMDTIPRPLLDRMDTIEITSYTQEEKFHIAKKHLISKQLKKHGLTKKMLSINDAAINDLIALYTREAGVRSLERVIASLCRKAAKEWLTKTEEEKKTIKITPKNLEKYLGPAKFKKEEARKESQVGVVTGLAYTTVGGETMPIEVSAMDGNGKIELTGSLGDVMKESARAAVSYIRSQADRFGIDKDFYKNKDIHIHVPEGAVPKDGPSAGITMATAIYSELTGKKVRSDVAMTGEITLRGNVLPIGGLREKTMAAFKYGIKTVIIPKENVSDLYEVEEVVKENINFIAAETFDDVLKVAIEE